MNTEELNALKERAYKTAVDRHGTVSQSLDTTCSY